MPANDKVIRISVDLLNDEYKLMHDACDALGVSHRQFAREAIREKIERANIGVATDGDALSKN